MTLIKKNHLLVYFQKKSTITKFVCILMLQNSQIRIKRTSTLISQAQLLRKLHFACIFTIMKVNKARLWDLC